MNASNSVSNFRSMRSLSLFRNTDHLFEIIWEATSLSLHWHTHTHTLTRKISLPPDYNFRKNTEKGWNESNLFFNWHHFHEIGDCVVYIVFWLIRVTSDEFFHEFFCSVCWLVSRVELPCCFTLPTQPKSEHLGCFVVLFLNKFFVSCDFLLEFGRKFQVFICSGSDFRPIFIWSTLSICRVHSHPLHFFKIRDRCRFLCKCFWFCRLIGFTVVVVTFIVVLESARMMIAGRCLLLFLNWVDSDIKCLNNHLTGMQNMLSATLDQHNDKGQ